MASAVFDPEIDERREDEDEVEESGSPRVPGPDEPADPGVPEPDDPEPLGPGA